MGISMPKWKVEIQPILIYLQAIKSVKHAIKSERAIKAWVLCEVGLFLKGYDTSLATDVYKTDQWIPPTQIPQSTVIVYMCIYVYVHK